MGKFYLLFLFVGICLCLWLRISVESTSYTSADSHFYLRVADNLKAGKGLLVPDRYPFNEQTPEHYLAIWPAAYPIMIALVSSLTFTSSLVASKIVNVLFLGLIFWLLYQWIGEKAWFPALYFCSYAMLEIYSYTWTEGPFLFFLLYLSYLLHQHQIGANRRWLAVELSFCLIALFTLRYAGLIYFFFQSLFLLYAWYQKDFKRSKPLFLSLLFASLFVLAYWTLNYLHTGYLTGGDRFYDEPDLAFFGLQLLQGVWNELLLARNYNPSSEPDYLLWALVLLQLVLAWFLFRQKHLLQVPFMDKKSPAALLIAIGLFYLPFIVLLSYLLWFDRFNYRILAPFSMPIMVGLMMLLTENKQAVYFRKTAPYITAFMLLSLLMNLPKMYILSKLGF